ncbi:MAG: 16S rRNA (guanine(527)-N(7))-methyltransferase RsmG [Gammaproteobacteria bacterium]|nr:16S rRNA (guanine(527)-N(7))-methyltransferase RsmG [Gammaproteobacteria bacterium]
MADCRQLLQEGCAALNLEISEDKVTKLLSFIDLLAKWNKAYNLTAINNKQEMVGLHLLDSLTVLPYLNGQRIIDIGTGAGLPGIPLAICRPDLNFTLLDSNAKKTRFVQQVILELNLPNAQVIHSRAQDFQPATGFDTVLTRAFADLSEIIVLVRHLAAINGKLIAMKAKCSEQELGKVSLPKDIIPVKIPGVAAERNLVCISL